MSELPKNVHPRVLRDIARSSHWHHRLVMRVGRRLYKWSQWCAWKADYWREWTKMRDEPYALAKLAAQQHEKTLLAADTWPYRKQGWIEGGAAGYEAKRSLSA